MRLLRKGYTFAGAAQHGKALIATVVLRVYLELQPYYS